MDKDNDIESLISVLEKFPKNTLINCGVDKKLKVSEVIDKLRKTSENVFESVKFLKELRKGLDLN